VITLKRSTSPSAAGLDLHTHSRHSDGVLAPAELARRLVRAGVRWAALTDHDTLAGVDEFRREGALHGLRALSGVEVSCACAPLKPLREAERSARQAEREARFQDPRRIPSVPASDTRSPDDPVEVHVLVYGIAPGEPAFEEFLAAVRAMRRERVAGMAARLAELGRGVDLTPLAERLDTGSVGRPHLARQLVAAGHVASVDEAFRSWLAEGRPAWLPKRLPEVGEALALAHSLGGVCVAAHPGKALPEAAPRIFLDLGLDGLEARHPSHRAARVEELRQLCRRNGLSASAGSDFHDPALGRYARPVWRREDVGGRLQVLLDRLS
jgi:predicted metal-dependent phosphoesterase TrpH